MFNATLLLVFATLHIGLLEAVKPTRFTVVNRSGVTLQGRVRRTGQSFLLWNDQSFSHEDAVTTGPPDVEIDFDRPCPGQGADFTIWRHSFTAVADNPAANWPYVSLFADNKGRQINLSEGEEKNCDLPYFVAATCRRGRDDNDRKNIELIIHRTPKACRDGQNCAGWAKDVCNFNAV